VQDEAPHDSCRLGAAYLSWARNQFNVADKTLNPKTREDHLVAAAYYLQLAEGELVATKRIAGP
jgi:hypothetical protein